MTTNCRRSCTPIGALAHTLRRVAYRSDPVFETWLGYDADGRLTTEFKVPTSLGDCSSAPGIETRYEYNAVGALERLHLPFGRSLHYNFATSGDSTRPGER